MTCFTVQGRDERGRWSNSRTFFKVYQELDSAIATAASLDEHGNDARVMEYATYNEAHRGKNGRIVWKAR
jgi:hypothetical protein